MKTTKIFTLFFISLFVVTMFSCNSQGTSHNNEAKESTDSVSNKTDSISALIQTLDSINNSGQLIHSDTYNIGKLKGIEISVKKVSVDSTNIAYINLRKDCGGVYYYSWEDAMIFDKELPSFYSAYSTIKNNLNRNVDHKEEYAYITKDDIALYASCEPNKSWTMRFSVDARKSNSVITLTASDLDNIIQQIKDAEKKLNEIK